MLRAALLLTVAISIATPASAQKGCEAGATGVTLNEHVEARRPVIAKRKLTGEERSEANRLISDIKSALKKKARPDHAQLDRLAVLGGSGDKEIMKVLVEGYDGAGAVEVSDAEGGKTWRAGTMLAGLWAVQLWREGERSKLVSLALDNCIVQASYGSDAKGRCGFSANIANDYRNTFNGHWTGKSEPPKSATFAEYTLLAAPEQEIARFEKALNEYRNADGDYGNDYNWATCWAGLKGGDYLARWNGSSQLAAANYKTGELNRQQRKQDEIDQNAAQWTALQAKRAEAKADGRVLSDVDEGKWAQLSFWLGGSYLLPYASEFVILDATSIDSLCRADSGKVCQRQQQLSQYRYEAGRSEQNMKEAALRNLTLGGGSVTVRNYDQDGNYLGTTSMPAWQADVAGAH